MSKSIDCQHHDTTKCRLCGEDRVKTFGRVSPDKRTIWVDEFGERWYGRKCPKCYTQYKLAYDEKNRLALGYRPFGSYDSCSQCQKRFVVKLGSSRRCPTCKVEHLKEALIRSRD
jgi:hypothetical protein